MFVQGAEGHGDERHAFRGTEAKAKQRHGQNQQIRLRSLACWLFFLFPTAWRIGQNSMENPGFRFSFLEQIVSVLGRFFCMEFCEWCGILGS